MFTNNQLRIKVLYINGNNNNNNNVERKSIQSNKVLAYIELEMKMTIKFTTGFVWVPTTDIRKSHMSIYFNFTLLIMVLN